MPFLQNYLGWFVEDLTASSLVSENVSKLQNFELAFVLVMSNFLPTAKQILYFSESLECIFSSCFPSSVSLLPFFSGNSMRQILQSYFGCALTVLKYREVFSLPLG